MWNREDPGQNYIMYDEAVSSTSNIPVAPLRQPDGSSLLCLSCHDGTIALGSVASTTIDIFDGNEGKMPAGSRGLLSLDLKKVKSEKVCCSHFTIHLDIRFWILDIGLKHYE